MKGNETYRLIVIEANEFGYYPPAALRASVVPGWENEVLVGLDKLFDDSSRHILMNKTKVISINENNVVVDNNSRIEEYTDNVIPYDILILATGSTYTMPCRPNNNTTEGIKSNLRKLQSEIKDSENIVIIGGGALGIEFAGEVQSYHHKRKNVKLIHSNDTLVGKEVGVHNTVLSQLHDLNIEVLLDDRVENIRDLSFGKCPEQVVKTKSGKEIKADFILNATGTRPNISLVENFDNSLISDKKLIKVKPTLQIDSPKLKRVFAMGDIVNIYVSL